ncbi:hypothetical protein FACS1894120_0110 [Clostridia bacterium]|nr:hypothetical protein FACS1894120_0110 [Clostridia bacterium]
MAKAFKNMKVGSKIFFGFAMVIALVVILAVVVVSTTATIISTVAQVEDSQELQSHVIDASDKLYTARISVNGFLTKYDESVYAEITPAFDNINADVKTIDDFFVSHPDLASAREHLKPAETSFADYQSYVGKYNDASKTADAAAKEVTDFGVNIETTSSQMFDYYFGALQTGISGGNLAGVKATTTALTEVEEYSLHTNSARVAVRKALETYSAENSAGALSNLQEAIDSYQSYKSKGAEAAQIAKMLDTLKQYQAHFVDYDNASQEKVKMAEAVRGAGAEAVQHFGALDDEAAKIVGDGMVNLKGTAAFALVAVIALSLFVVVVSLVIAKVVSNIIVTPIHRITGVLSEVGEKGVLKFTPDVMNELDVISQGKDEIASCVRSAIKVTTRFERIAQRFEQLSDGDLTFDVNVLSEHDTIGITLTKLVKDFNQMFGALQSTATEVKQGAEGISEGSQTLAQGSTEQAATVEQLSASISDIATKTQENTDRADSAAELSQAIKVNAERGNHQMGEMMEAVREINEASTNIKKVIKVIDDIAFQTNILALNAAVEAARAGEAGKGFAVVADEVRNLAAKSAAAAKETGELIENSMKKAEKGSVIAEETAKSLSDIISGIDESNTVIRMIARSSEEQNSAVSQINEAIGQVSDVVQRNSATAEESAASSQELTSQSVVLADYVAKFKLKEGGSRSVVSI